MKQTKYFYEVNAYVKMGSVASETFYRLDRYRAEVEDGVAVFKKPHHYKPEAVLESSLCWSPEDAFKLHLKQAQLRVERAEVELVDAKKELLKAEYAEAHWKETGREVGGEE